jgi:hypothetical protein
MAVSREEMLMQSIATGSPSNVVPITREEKYLSFIAGESANKPNAPITRKEVFLDKIPQGGSSGGGVTIRNQNKTITENGTYTADSGYTGLGTVTVEVAGGGSDNNFDEFVTGSTGELRSAATSVDSDAFKNNTKLTSANFPNATSIGSYAFNSCSKLTSASFSKATVIGTYAFGSCVALTSINFPNATSIETNAFNSCSKLTSANFPKATRVSTNAFQNCSKLTSANFPSLTRIDMNVFRFCYELTSADFSNITSIGMYAFGSCYLLKAVILRSTTMVTLSQKNALENCYHILGTVDSTYNPNGDKDGYFYVPRALLSDDDATKDYRRATNWATYASQFRALEDYTVDGTITGDLDPNKI